MDRRTFAGSIAAMVTASLDVRAGAQDKSVATPEATPNYAPVAEGLRASVACFFTTVSDSGWGIFYVEARVAEFENSGHALGIVSEWFAQIEEFSHSNYTLQLSPVAVKRIADSSRMMMGKAVHVTDEDYTYDVMALAVTEGNVLYSFVVWSTYKVGENEIVGIAERTLGIEPLEYEPVPDVDYEVGGLWDLLPRIEHMPQGLTWDSDVAPCVGVFGINDCIDE